MILFLFAAFFTITSAYCITIYGDVHKDVEFFTRTLPWIIDNVGGDLYLEYNLLGSGRYSVPQMCVLQELYNNPFLQAQYLKCEAEGNPSEYCLCETGIYPEHFRYCVAAGAYYASQASQRFLELGIDTTPIIELEPKSTVFGVDDIWYLRKICTTVFGEYMPRGCIKPSIYDQNESFQRRAIAQFERVCHKEFPGSCDDDKPVSTSVQRSAPTYATELWPTRPEPAPTLRPATEPKLAPVPGPTFWPPIPVPTQWPVPTKWPPKKPSLSQPIVISPASSQVPPVIELTPLTPAGSSQGPSVIEVTPSGSSQGPTVINLTPSGTSQSLQASEGRQKAAVNGSTDVIDTTNNTLAEEDRSANVAEFDKTV